MGSEIGRRKGIGIERVIGRERRQKEIEGKGC